MLPIPFANPATYPGHSGVDYAQARGTIFRASGPGRVVSRGRNARGGFYIWVQYDNGPLVGYHHMDNHNDCPPVGTRVSEGSQLGKVGNTGNSTGPHLHSEVSGHATTAGYWKFFTASRVVGQANSAGNESEDDDMGMLDDSEHNQVVLGKAIQRALKFDVRPNGYGANWELGPTIWERLNQIETAARTNGDITLSDEDVKLIADAIPKGLASKVIDELKTRL